MSYWEANGKSNDWYTPQCVFEALGCRFDMDVAAPMLIPAYIGARRWLWKDSLATPWEGFVWMNPPFGGRNGIAPWLDKFFAHGDGIALTPDRTSAPWFQQYAPHSHAILFTRKLRFVRPDGSEGKSPSNGTALLAIGAKGVCAVKRAADRGFGVLSIPLPGEA